MLVFSSMQITVPSFGRLRYSLMIRSFFLLKSESLLVSQYFTRCGLTSAVRSHREMVSRPMVDTIFFFTISLASRSTVQRAYGSGGGPTRAANTSCLWDDVNLSGRPERGASHRASNLAPFAPEANRSRHFRAVLTSQPSSSAMWQLFHRHAARRMILARSTSLCSELWACTTRCSMRRSRLHSGLWVAVDDGFTQSGFYACLSKSCPMA